MRPCGARPPLTCANGMSGLHWKSGMVVIHCTHSQFSWL